MNRLMIFAPTVGAAVILAACTDQTPEAPAQPPTTEGALEISEPLVMPPEEAEVPPATGQGAPMPQTPPVLPEEGPPPTPADSLPPKG